MNKKVLIPVMALLVLFVVAPAMAAPAAKIKYTADVSLVIISPGEEWTTEGGILHVKGLIANGTFVSSLGISGVMLKKLDFTLNTITGKGTMNGKFVLTVGEVGTFEGSFRDKITEFNHYSGTVVGQGTGGFAGLKTMGTWEGEKDGNAIVNVLDAIILSPKGPL